MYDLIRVDDFGDDEPLTTFFRKPSKKDIRDWALKYMGSEDTTSYKIIKK